VSEGLRLRLRLRLRPRESRGREQTWSSELFAGDGGDTQTIVARVLRTDHRMRKASKNDDYDSYYRSVPSPMNADRPMRRERENSRCTAGDG
jgi:hypothetical protein